MTTIPPSLPNNSAILSPQREKFFFRAQKKMVKNMGEEKSMAPVA